MDHNKTTLERAFDLACAGHVNCVADLRAQLKAEGYSDQQVQGRSLVKQLVQMIRKTRADAN